MNIRFLGTGTCLPSVDRDTASLLIDDCIMLDTGWHPVRNLLMAGAQPTDVRHLLFSHLHHDHMMGLPALLFYQIHASQPLSSLHIYGPAESLERAVQDALRFIQADVYWPDVEPPTLHLLPPDGTFTLEGTGLTVKHMASLHAVHGRCYVIESAEMGVRVGISGDTAYQSKYAEFFAGCDALIYEYSWGHAIQGDNKPLHSSASVAAQVAHEAGVRALLPVHGPADADAYLLEMQAIYSGRLHFPRDGECVRMRDMR